VSDEEETPDDILRRLTGERFGRALWWRRPKPPKEGSSPEAIEGAANKWHRLNKREEGDEG